MGSGIGALAVKKKAAARTAQEEILLELKPVKTQKTKRPTIKKDQAITNQKSEFISSTRTGPLFLGQSSSRNGFFLLRFLLPPKENEDARLFNDSKLKPISKNQTKALVSIMPIFIYGLCTPSGSKPKDCKKTNSKPNSGK